MPPITAEQDRWWTRSETASRAVACDPTSAGVALLCVYTAFACLFHLSASYYVRKGHVLKRFKCSNQSYTSDCLFFVPHDGKPPCSADLPRHLRLQNTVQGFQAVAL